MIARSRAGGAARPQTTKEIMRSPKPVSIGRRYGALVIARFLPDGMVFSTCDCGSSRTTTKAQLGKSIRSCAKCAQANKRMGGRRPEPVILPEPVLQPEAPRCHPQCTLRIVERQVYEAHNPDCEILGLFRIDLLAARKADQRVYPATVI